MQVFSRVDESSMIFSFFIDIFGCGDDFLLMFSVLSLFFFCQILILMNPSHELYIFPLVVL